MWLYCACIVQCMILCKYTLISISTLFHFLFFTIVYPSSSPGNPAGTITIQAEEVRNSEFVVYFELSATKLEKKDLFGKVSLKLGINTLQHYMSWALFFFSLSHHSHTHSHTHTLTHTHILSLTHTTHNLCNMQSDPYIEIAKAQEGGEFTVVYRSKPIMKTLSPRYTCCSSCNLK